MQRAKITFWGVRGSVASAGPKTAMYGGNTACLEIRSGDTIIICDAGTGIRTLGHSLIKRARGKKIKAHILLSHTHLDHIIGLPFFKPIFDKRSNFTIICPGKKPAQLKNALHKAISHPYFPIDILKVPARLKFGALSAGRKIGTITASCFECSHPDKSYAFKFRFPNKKGRRPKTLVHVSDNEPSSKIRASFVEWLKGTDILIHDAQYTPKQYTDKRGWGHSPYTYPIKLAEEAGIKKLALFHYDPAASDKNLDAILKAAKKFSRRIKWNGTVFLSKEGMTFTI